MSAKPRRKRSLRDPHRFAALYSTAFHLDLLLGHDRGVVQGVDFGFE